MSAVFEWCFFLPRAGGLRLSAVFLTEVDSTAVTLMERKTLSLLENHPGFFLRYCEGISGHGSDMRSEICDVIYCGLFSEEQSNYLTVEKLADSS